MAGRDDERRPPQRRDRPTLNGALDSQWVKLFRLVTPAGVIGLIPLLITIAGSLSASCEATTRVASIEAAGIELRLAVDRTLDPPHRAFLQRQIRELRQVAC